MYGWQFPPFVVRVYEINQMGIGEKSDSCFYTQPALRVDLFFSLQRTRPVRVLLSLTCRIFSTIAARPSADSTWMYSPGNLEARKEIA